MRTTTTTQQRDPRAVILGRDDWEAVAAVLGTSPTTQGAWDDLMDHRTPAGFVMPEWRRRQLEELKNNGGRIVAARVMHGGTAL